MMTEVHRNQYIAMRSAYGAEAPARALAARARREEAARARREEASAAAEAQQGSQSSTFEDPQAGVTRAPRRLFFDQEPQTFAQAGINVVCVPFAGQGWRLGDDNVDGAGPAPMMNESDGDGNTASGSKDEAGTSDGDGNTARCSKDEAGTSDESDAGACMEGGMIDDDGEFQPHQTLLEEQRETEMLRKWWIASLPFLDDIEIGEIFVKTASGHTIVLENLKGTDCAETVKARIMDKRVRLTVAGKELENGRELLEYNIQKWTTIEEQSRLKGGGRGIKQAMLKSKEIAQKKALQESLKEQGANHDPEIEKLNHIMQVFVDHLDAENNAGLRQLANMYGLSTVAELAVLDLVRLNGDEELKTALEALSTPGGCSTTKISKSAKVLFGEPGKAIATTYDEYKGILETMEMTMMLASEKVPIGKMRSIIKRVQGERLSAASSSNPLTALPAPAAVPKASGAVAPKASGAPAVLPAGGIDDALAEAASRMVID